MHIPDGLMDPLVVAIGWIVSILVISIAVIRVNKTIDDRTIPFMAVLAAGLFVAQMLNFPVGGGTTGHFLGAALVTIILGPFAAMIVMTVILTIQAFLFGDGGVTALGLNILNMAVIAPISAWMIMKLAAKRFARPSIIAAAWISTFISALATAFELATSYDMSNGAYGIIAAVSFPSMIVSYALIGIGEAIITGGVVLYLSKVAPETMKYGMKMMEA